MEALRAADAAIIVCSAKDGISVGFEKVWKYCQERDMPRFIYISKTDEENSDYNATFNALREKYGNKIAPLVVPMWDADKNTTGLIDVLNKRAYELQDYKRVEVDIPRRQGGRGLRVQRGPEGVRGRNLRGDDGQVLRRRGLHLRRDDPGPAPGRAGAVHVPPSSSALPSTAWAL